MNFGHQFLKLGNIRILDGFYWKLQHPFLFGRYEFLKLANAIDSKHPFWNCLNWEKSRFCVDFVETFSIVSVKCLLQIVKFSTSCWLWFGKYDYLNFRTHLTNKLNLDNLILFNFVQLFLILCLLNILILFPSWILKELWNVKNL